MFERFQENNRFLKIFLSVNSKSFKFFLRIHFNFLQNVVPSYYLMVWWWLQMKGQSLANASNKETEGGNRSNVACSITFQIF